MAKNRKYFRYNMNYSAGKFMVNNDAVFGKLKAVYFRYENVLSSEDLRQILYMVKTMERKQMRLSVQENASMNSILTHMNGKYAAIVQQEAIKNNMLVRE